MWLDEHESVARCIHTLVAVIWLQRSPLDLRVRLLDRLPLGPLLHLRHALPIAQLVSVVVAAYRNARRTGQNLAATVRHIDQAVTELFPDAFTTAVLAELDTTTGLLSGVSAGHPPPLLLRDGYHVKTLDAEPILPLGLGFQGGQLEVGTEQLQPGDHVLIYTDGVIEARSPDGELFVRTGSPT